MKSKVGDYTIIITGTGSHPDARTLMKILGPYFDSPTTLRTINVMDLSAVDTVEFDRCDECEEES